MTEPRTFRFTNSREARNDVARLLAVRLASTFQSRIVRARMILAALGAGALGGIGAALIVRFTSINPAASFWIVLATALASTTLWKRYDRSANHRIVGNLSGQSPLFSGEQLWHFTPEGLRMENSVSNTFFDWAAFDNVLQGSEGLGLTSGAIYFALPIAAVGSAEEASALRRQIEIWMARA